MDKQVGRYAAAAAPGGGATVRRSAAVTALSVAVAALAASAAATGLFAGSGGGPVQFTTVRGEVVDLYGQGLYRYDTVFAGAGQRGTDTVVLLLGVPLLLAAAWRFWRGSSRSGLLLFGVHVFFLYVYGSAALGTVAYNRLFPLYVVVFSASSYALVLLVAAVDRTELAARVAHAPRRAPGLFMLLSGVVTLLVWGVPAIAAAIGDDPTARLDSYASDVTYALDLGIITPAALVAGAMILRRASGGYLLALSLLFLETMLAPLIAAQTLAQLAAGVAFTAAEVVGPMAGFVLIAGAASWFGVGLLRSLGQGQPSNGGVRAPQLVGPLPWEWQAYD